MESVESAHQACACAHRQYTIAGAVPSLRTGVVPARNEPSFAPATGVIAACRLRVASARRIVAIVAS